MSMRQSSVIADDTESRQESRRKGCAADEQTHINPVVRDVERSLRFYGQVFGGRNTGGPKDWSTPERQDVITFDEQASGAGESRGIAHFGFRLVSPGDIDAAVDEVKRAGGLLFRRGEFSPGYPCAYVADPDGYEVEIWYE